jgi:Zn-dependent protease
MQNPSSALPDPAFPASSNGESAAAPPELVAELLRFEPKPRRIGEILVDRGLATEAEVAHALREQATDARPLGELLVAQGVCTSEQVSQALQVQAMLTSPLWNHMGEFRWKEGLSVTRIEETHRQAVVVSLGDRHVQLSPEEFQLAEGLVSETSFGAIARRCWNATGQLVWPEQLIALTTRLWMLGLLSMDQPDRRAELTANQTDSPLSAPQPEPPRAGWARWFQLRIPFHDPTRLLDLTWPLGRGFFTRAGATATAALVVLATLILAMHGARLWELIVGNFQHRWVGGVGSFVIAYLLCSTIHEYGHAMACRAFGGNVTRMGVMLYVCIPMAFCDVSDAHRFSEKWKRIVVSAAGIYFQLLLAAIAGLAWALLALPASVELVLAQIVAITLVATLANLNPLLKLDGYYILSDWLEIPNLRPRAFATLDRLARRLPVSGEMRERRAFLWYGVLGGSYTVAIAGYVTWRFAHFVLRTAGLA